MHEGIRHRTYRALGEWGRRIAGGGVVKSYGMIALCTPIFHFHWTADQSLERYCISLRNRIEHSLVAVTQTNNKQSHDGGSEHRDPESRAPSDRKHMGCR